MEEKKSWQRQLIGENLCPKVGPWGERTPAADQDQGRRIESLGEKMQDSDFLKCHPRHMAKSGNKFFGDFQDQGRRIEQERGKGKVPFK